MMPSPAGSGAQPGVPTSLRLRMRRYVAQDIAQLASVFADPYAQQFYPAQATHEGLERWIAWNLRNYEAHGFGLWALELADTGQFIGDAGITYQTPQGAPILEIGWHIHPDFRRQGYATEAGLACLAYGFAVLDAPHISSIVNPRNAASMQVAARVHSDCTEYAGKAGPMLLYATTAAQFGVRQSRSKTP